MWCKCNIYLIPLLAKVPTSTATTQQCRQLVAVAIPPLPHHASGGNSILYAVQTSCLPLLTALHSWHSWSCGPLPRPDSPAPCRRPLYLWSALRFFNCNLRSYCCRSSPVELSCWLLCFPGPFEFRFMLHLGRHSFIWTWLAGHLLWHAA